MAGLARWNTKLNRHGTDSFCRELSSRWGFGGPHCFAAGAAGEILWLRPRPLTPSADPRLSRFMDVHREFNAVVLFTFPGLFFSGRTFYFLPPSCKTKYNLKVDV